MKKIILAILLGGLIIVNLPWIYNQIEVNDKGYRDADVLARQGPAGALAYHIANRDGKITRGELTDIRLASTSDIDRRFGINQKEP
jgi:hypothetical protein